MTPFIGVFIGLVLALSPLHVAGLPTHEADVLSAVPDVPYFSQFSDIEWPAWRGKACGVTDLAMLIEFYRPGTVLPQTLLEQGLATGAYLENVGWTYGGLIGLARKYGLDGESYDMSGLRSAAAFEKLTEFLKEGPVIASVYYKFEPGNPIPHLAVITGIDGDTVYYNDPAGYSGPGTISVADFMKAWKKRLIVIRPISR